ncbi:hypothetical protein KBD34_05595 [Patescibacteria group bacterium]|nr:hypothetical protein [Patescibacteria group bacterium]
MSEKVLEELRKAVEVTLAERTKEVVGKLDASAYPEGEHSLNFDAPAFNVALGSIYAALQAGTFFQNVVGVTEGAFEAMKGYWKSLPPPVLRPGAPKPPEPILSSSYTGQMLCATIYELTQGKLKEDPLLGEAEAVAKAADEEQKLAAQDRLFQSAMADDEAGFQQRWFAAANELVGQLRKHNAENPNLRAFLAPVSYEAMPSKSELEKNEFREANEVFDGPPFVKHPTCEGMDEAAGVRIMCLRTSQKNYKLDEAITDMADKKTSFAPNGFRPGTEKDLRFFARVDPDQLNDVHTVAPGAQVTSRNYNWVAMVVGEPGWRGLRNRPHDYDWNSKFRTLFIAK